MPVAASAGCPAVSAVDSPTASATAAVTASPLAQGVERRRTTPRRGRRRAGRRRTRWPGASSRIRRHRRASPAGGRRAARRCRRCLARGRRSSTAPGAGWSACGRRRPCGARGRPGLRCAASSASSWPRMAASSRRSSAPGSKPSSSASTRRASRKARSASAWRPDRYSASISWPRSRSRNGIARDRGVEVGDQVGVATHRQQRVEPVLDGRPPATPRSELAAATARRHVAELGERSAPPLPERLVEAVDRGLGAAVGERRRGLADEPFEAVGVDVLRRDHRT